MEESPPVVSDSAPTSSTVASTTETSAEGGTQGEPELLWGVQFGGLFDDRAADVALGSDGTVYVVGEVREAVFGEHVGAQTITPNLMTGELVPSGDAFIAAYDRDGVLLWSDQFGSAGDDAAWRVALSDAGQVVVVGASSGSLGAESSGSLDGFVAVYEPDGRRAWVSQGGGSEVDVFDKVVVRRDGSVVVAGYSTPDEDEALLAIEPFLSVHNPGGEAQAFEVEIASGELPVIHSISGLDDGTVVAMGLTYRGDARAFEVSLEFDGSSVTTEDLPSDFERVSAAVTLDDLRVVTAGGRREGAGEAALRLHDHDGSLVWSAPFGPDLTTIVDLMVASSGTFYSSGYGRDVALSDTHEAVVFAHSPEGNELWRHSFGTSAQDELGGFDVLDDCLVAVAGRTGGDLFAENVKDPSVLDDRYDAFVALFASPDPACQ